MTWSAARAMSYFNAAEQRQHRTHLGEQAHVVRKADRSAWSSAITSMTTAYEKGEIDRLFLVHNVYRQHHEPDPPSRSCCRWRRIDRDEMKTTGTTYTSRMRGELLDNVLQ